jgi:hypothetical protein
LHEHPPDSVVCVYRRRYSRTELPICAQATRTERPMSPAERAQIGTYKAREAKTDAAEHH